MSRILLLSSNFAEEPYPVYPLGLSTVAAALVQAGHEVRQFDFAAKEKSEERFRDTLRSYSPDFAGISIRNIDNVDSFTSDESWRLQDNKRVVEIIREESDARVIVGGSGYSLLPEEVLDYLKADFGVVGEGERVLCELIHGLVHGKAVPSIVHGNDDLLDGRAIPEPCWDPSIIAHYRDLSLMGVQTKRGCVHRCLYCNYSKVDGDGLRCRETGAVADEVERLHVSFGISRFFFTDSVFNDSEGHYLAVAEEIIRRNLPITWSAFFRPERMDRGSLRLLKRAGLRSIEAGTDAASDETLSELCKPFTFNDVLAFQDVCTEEEIPCAHYVMFGCPGETEETLQTGLGNLERLKQCVVFAFSGIRLFPRTRLHARACEEGLLTSETNLLMPLFYFSPGLDRERLTGLVKRSFGRRRDRIFPPSEARARRKVLNRMGYYGSLWEGLIRFTPRG